MPVLQIENVETEMVNAYRNASPKTRERAFIAFKKILTQTSEEGLPASKETKPSKWALLVEEVENEPDTGFDGYSEQIKKDMKEFRDNFAFDHDL